MYTSVYLNDSAPVGPQVALNDLHLVRCPHGVLAARAHVARFNVLPTAARHDAADHSVELGTPEPRAVTFQALAIEADKRQLQLRVQHARVRLERLVEAVIEQHELHLSRPRVRSPSVREPHARQHIAHRRE